MGKNVSNKYSQKPLHSSKKYTTDAVKVVSKRAIQKTAEATGDLFRDKIADEITKASQKKLIMKYQKKNISFQKKDNN